MSHSITLSADQRRTLLDYYRSPLYPPDLHRRAHILLLLADGYPWATIAAVLYCSTRTIARWKGRFELDGLEALFGHRRGPKPRFAPGWVAVAVAWVTSLTPRAFGLFRSRWCCEAVARVLHQVHGLTVSRETVRYWLLQAGLVDEFLVYQAPKLVGQGRGMLRAGPLESLDEAVALRYVQVSMCGDDLRIIARPPGRERF